MSLFLAVALFYTVFDFGGLNERTLNQKKMAINFIGVHFSGMRLADFFGDLKPGIRVKSRRYSPNNPEERNKTILKRQRIFDSWFHCLYIRSVSIKVAKYTGKDKVDLIESEEYGYCSLLKATDRGT